MKVIFSDRAFAAVMAETTEKIKTELADYSLVRLRTTYGILSNLLIRVQSLFLKLPTLNMISNTLNI